MIEYISTLPFCTRPLHGRVGVRSSGSTEVEDGIVADGGMKGRGDLRILDVGTGNGHMLFALREQGWQAEMVGVDYSEQSVELARRIDLQRCRERDEPSEPSELSEPVERGGPSKATGSSEPTEQSQRSTSPAPYKPITFTHYNILTPAKPSHTSHTSPSPRSFDFILDKGTFDAISLSPEPISEGNRRRGCEVYGSRVAHLMREGGFLVVVSCNWTEGELEGWICGGEDQLDVYGRVKFPSFEFGGVKGQAVSCLCFRKVEKGDGVESEDCGASW